MDVKLIVIGGKGQGREIPISRPQFLIGRAEGCQLRPASERVSRRHCVILVEENRVLLRDLKSTNRTLVNQEPIQGDRELKNGDRLNVAGVLEFEVQVNVAAKERKKTKIHSIQEAAARTVQSAAGEELDISNWLETEENAPSPPAADPSLKNTRTDISLTDTTTILQPHQPEDDTKHGKKKTGKSAKSFEQMKKPPSESSQEAADDILRQFFGRKRS
ncbi:MAG: FHA domain-containing protein [Pirellulales bacterium]|nr:FHA domain-containing protein [Pirellulales bacterium]